MWGSKSNNTFTESVNIFCILDVTVMYGNEERWKSVRKRGVLRDKNGTMILPLIMLKRTEIAKNTLSTNKLHVA